MTRSPRYRLCGLITVAKWATSAREKVTSLPFQCAEALIYIAANNGRHFVQIMSERAAAAAVEDSAKQAPPQMQSHNMMTSKTCTPATLDSMGSELIHACAAQLVEPTEQHSGSLLWHTAMELPGQPRWPSTKSF